MEKIQFHAVETYKKLEREASVNSMNNRQMPDDVFCSNKSDYGTFLNTYGPGAPRYNSPSLFLETGQNRQDDIKVNANTIFSEVRADVQSFTENYISKQNPAGLMNMTAQINNHFEPYLKEFESAVDVDGDGQINSQEGQKIEEAQNKLKERIDESVKKLDKEIQAKTKQKKNKNVTNQNTYFRHSSGCEYYA